MKSLIISLSLTLILLNSCDKRHDYFEEINKAPVLKIGLDQTQLDDENIIDSLKIGQEDIDLFYSIEDEIIKAPSIQTNHSILFAIQENKIIISPSEQGQYTFDIIVEDAYKKSVKMSYSLLVFENLTPVTVAKIENTALFDDKEIEIDASESYDVDKAFGGRIVEYEYNIDDQNITITPLNKIKTILPTHGTHTIEVRVKDNNNTWSAKQKLYITI